MTMQNVNQIEAEREAEMEAWWNAHVANVRAGFAARGITDEMWDDWNEYKQGVAERAQQGIVETGDMVENFLTD
ncbi:MAG: hypothetical protein ACRCZ2_12670, partial [Fusobacteriaceae bacterium]